MTKISGFYLVGFFDKYVIGKWMVTKKKPFVFDTIMGEVHGKGFNSMSGYHFPKEWIFIEDKELDHLDYDEDLRQSLNSIWKDWCIKYKRKYSPIFDERSRNK